MSIELTDEFLSKARKVKNAKRSPIHSSSGKDLNSFYYSSTPKEAVFKVINDHSNIGKGTIKGYTVKKAIQYIGTDKEDELENKPNDDLNNEIEDTRVYNLETHNGEKLTSIDEINQVFNEWKTTFSSDKRKNGKDAEHILFSTSEKPGATNEQILAAARETLNREFKDKGFEYVFALHTDKEHTHVHAIVRSYNPETQKQLDLRKDDLKNIRTTWANNLQEQGLNYVVSINIDRIKSMSERLEYIKTKNMSWFEANMEKMKTTNVQELGDKLLKTQDEISTLKHRKNEINKELKTIFYNKDKNIKKDDLRTELYHINKDISQKYADVKASITLLNNIEYEAQVANINYEKLRENQSKITGVFVKNSRSYQELSQQVENARHIMLEKKLELDQAHIFLSKLNRDKKYNIDLESNKGITYGFSNLDTSIKTLKTILQEENRLDKSIISQSLLHIDKLSQAPNETTTYNNKKTIQNLTELKKEYLENNPLPKFNKEIRDIIHAELKSVLAAQKENYYNHKSLTKDEYLKSIRDIRSLQQNIRKNYEIPIYKLKKHGVDISKFATKEVALKTNAIKLNDSDKNIILKELNKIQEKESFTQKSYLNKIITQVKEQDTIYQSQLNRLQIDSKMLFKELSVKDFTKVDIKQEVVNTEKTYVNWQNNDYIHIVNNKNMDYKSELEKLKSVDFNSLDKNERMEAYAKLNTVSQKAIENKDLESFDSVNKIDMVDTELTIKGYGEILQVSPKKINLEIWESLGEKREDYNKSLLTGLSELYDIDYKKEFMNRYIDELKNEYALQKDMPLDLATEKEWNNYFDTLKNFDTFCDSFKEQYDNNKEKEYQTKDIIEKLENGEFIAANKLIDKLDEFDKLYIQSYYDYAINDYANNLDAIKDNIDFNSSILEKSYLIDPDDSIYKKDKAQEKPTFEKVDLQQDKKEEKVHTDKIDLHQDKAQEKPTLEKVDLSHEKPKLNYEALVKNEDTLIKNLIEKIDTNLYDHNKREQEKINSINLSNKDKILSAANSITYALHSNLKELKDTYKYIGAIQHEPSGLEYKDKLMQNEKEYGKLAVELNTKLNTFITNVQNSKLTKEEKTEIVKSVYTKLDDKNYANEIRKFVKSPTLDNEINKRHINQFKELTNELKSTKNPQELSELAAKSKSMMSRFKESNLSMMEQLKVKSIEKNHKSILNSMNRGFGR